MDVSPVWEELATTVQIAFWDIIILEEPLVFLVIPLARSARFPLQIVQLVLVVLFLMGVLVKQIFARITILRINTLMRVRGAWQKLMESL